MPNPLEALAIRTIAEHVRRLATITDDIPAVVILIDCHDRLKDRADFLAYEKEKTNHEARQP